MLKATLEIDQDKKNHLKCKKSTEFFEEIYKLKENTKNNQTNLKVQITKKHLQTMFNRNSKSSRREKELYQ